MKSGEPHKKDGREMGEITKGGLGGSCGWGAGGDVCLYTQLKS